MQVVSQFKHPCESAGMPSQNIVYIYQFILYINVKIEELYHLSP